MRLTTRRGARRGARAPPGYNLFDLHAEDVLIDLLTDFGHRRDVARPVGRHPARRRALRRLAVVVRVPRGGPGAVPVRARHPDPPGPRGREDPVLASSAGRARSIPNNTHFDTTRANVESTGAEAVDLVIAEGRDPVGRPSVQGQHGRRRARGAPDRARRGRRPGRVRDGHQQLAAAASRSRSRTCARCARVCDRYGVPLFLDACRFAENAWFIQRARGRAGGPVDPRHRARDGRRSPTA